MVTFKVLVWHRLVGWLIFDEGLSRADAIALVARLEADGRDPEEVDLMVEPRERAVRQAA